MNKKLWNQLKIKKKKNILLKNLVLFYGILFKKLFVSQTCLCILFKNTSDIKYFIRIL